MDFQNTDDAVRKDACEKVKQIVKAIKAIKIKYYLIFSKISAKDRETYQKLENELDRISEEHNLNNLKVALMSEVNARYNGENPDDMNQGKQSKPEDIIQACYGAVDAQKEALSRGRISQALRCQEQLRKYIQKLGEKEYSEVINYKREKFAELMRSREQVEEQVNLWNDAMKNMYKAEDAQARKDLMTVIKDVQHKENKKSLENGIEIASF